MGENEVEVLREKVLELLAMNKITPEAAFVINQLLIDLELEIEKLKKKVVEYEEFVWRLKRLL